MPRLTERTARRYFDDDLQTAATPSTRTTSPSYIAQEWTADRTLGRIQIATGQADVRQASGLIAAGHTQELERLARMKALTPGKELVTELAAVHGFSWTDIGKLLDVSVPAIRKWRLDGQVSPVNVSRLARLAAFAELLQRNGIRAAAWMSTPLLDGYSVAPKHLYREGQAGALADVALDPHGDVRETLDTLQSGWRDKYDNHGYQVVRFAHGDYGTTKRTT